MNVYTVDPVDDAAAGDKRKRGLDEPTTQIKKEKKTMGGDAAQGGEVEVLPSNGKRAHIHFTANEHRTWLWDGWTALLTARVFVLVCSGLCSRSVC